MTTVIGASTLRDALDALAQWAEKREREGGRNLVFCEDRLTLLAERAVLSRIGGTMRTEVTTFARFLSGEKRVISKQASVMAVSSLLRTTEGLRVFGQRSAQAVYETLAQLSASCVDADALRMGAEETEGTLRGKLFDLATLFEKYNDFLRGRGLLDENGYLSLLPEKLSEELKDVNVMFFAFPSFTRQALEGVRAACLNARSTSGILIAGEGEIYTNEAISAFVRIAKECGETRTVRMPCELRGDALSLRGALFSPEVFSRAKQEVHSIRAFTAKDEAREAEAVAALIKKEVYEKGIRFRDIAVLVPSSESFLTVGRVFDAFSVPYYADRKKPYSEHPFCMFALDVLSAVSDGGTGASIDAVLSGLYFGNADEYRNYLLRYGGYRGAVNREIKSGEAVKGYDREALLACREKIRAILSLVPRKGTANVFVQAVRNLLAFTDAERVTEELASRRDGEERAFLSLDTLDKTLEEFSSIAGEEVLTAREFSTLLRSALEAIEVSVLPRRGDAVFVGDITESKISEAKLVFGISLTDALPRVSQDTAVISDGEMERLSRLRVQIEPAIAVVNARARESLALNLCAFTDELFVSCPERFGGKEARPSEALSYLRGAFLLPPLPELFPYDCCERVPALLAMLRYRDRYERGMRSGTGNTDGERFSAVREALIESGEGRLAEELLAGGEKRPVPSFSDLVFRGEISPTLLEKYFECPYAGFMERALRLKDREERRVVEADAGSFVHEVLAAVAASFNEVKSEEECRTLAGQKAKELLSSPRYSAFGDTGEGEYTGEWLVKECSEVTAAAYRQLADSLFRVEGAERDVRLPMLSMKGRADRIDGSEEYVRVIDYKTGGFDQSPTAYYTGRRLQLELYLLGASEGKTPAGAFYFPAADSYTKEGEGKFRMQGFFSEDEEVRRRMDPSHTEGKSAYYDGGGAGKNGLPSERFEKFLSYAVLVSEGAKEEMKAGNVSPSPYEGACEYCKFKGMCGFTGVPRKAPAATCAEIAAIAEGAREEKR